MTTYFIMATRQLTGYSGSDLYINLGSNDDICLLFDYIQKTKNYTVNNKDTSYDNINNIAHFTICEPLLKKIFYVHVKAQKDGLWFRLTEYIKYQKITPGQFLVLNIEVNESNTEISMYGLEFYEYILQKHNNHYVLMSEKKASDGHDELAEEYLRKFNIIKTNSIVEKWHNQFISYQVDGYSKKYIGVPQNTLLKCDEFNNIGDII